MRQHKRLDDAIGDRRLQRSLSWGQLAAAVGVSESGLRNIRRGRNEPSPLTKHRIERALHWADGSIDAILDGGDPTELAADQQVAYTAGWDLDDERLAVMLQVVDHRLLLAELERRLNGRD